MGAILDKRAIFAAKDIKIQLVSVPEWGGDVLVRGLTGHERDRFESTILDQRGKKTKIDLSNARARLVAMALIDNDGKLLFSDDEVGILGTKSAAALDRIYDVAAALSGISDEDIDELLGKDGATTGGGSPSA